MHIRRLRSALSAAVLPVALALLGIVTAACAAAADEDPSGTSTAYTTLLILAVVGIVLVIAWIVANRLRKPPRG